MGISPIEYKPWKGERTAEHERAYVIAKDVLMNKMKSKGVLAVLIIGMILVHVFPAIFQSLIPHKKFTADMMIGHGFMGSYLKGGLYVIFSLLLASVVTSDIISQDLKDNSFVLYFSRSITPVDYLLGKVSGGFTVMGMFCTLPLIAVGLAIIATQTGSDYGHSFEILGKAASAGLLTQSFFLFYGVMLSSFTKRKAYAGVGTFMSFFVLTIVAEVFAEFDENWKLLSPLNLLNYSYDRIFGYNIPNGVDEGLHSIVIAAVLIVPLVVLYLQTYRRA
ncbi:MAG: ABC transporter permease subunit [Thermoplasmata archaeon]